MKYKTALVTGGARGLGAAIAVRFAGHGLNTAIVGRDEKALQETAHRIQQAGGRCIWRICDVGDWGAVSNTVEEVIAELGSIDVLVNNAGGWLGGNVSDMNSERFASLLAASLGGTFHFSKAVIPHMQRMRRGFILNIGSTSGLPSSLDAAVASAPKAAVDSFTRALAREIHVHGIRVAILHPARISKKSEDEAAESADEEGRYVTLAPRQVAEVALFMIDQPDNVAIREVVVTPVNVAY